MKILCLGDVVGPAGAKHLCKNLWEFRKREGVSFVVANCENADEGNGLSSSSAKLLIERGVDVITTGNHVWRKNDLRPLLDSSDSVIRPLNYPPSCPGKGYTLCYADGYRILVMNVMGTVYMDSLACPFHSVDSALKKNEGRYDIAVLDIHAEATSEKMALGYYLDGRVNIIAGTHTHVQTADERVLPKGSGYITDLGMCGSTEGVLGVEKDIIIGRLRTKMPARHIYATENPVAFGAIFTFDTDKKRVTEVKRVRF